ncbi:Nucleotidyltransferase [Rickenella mellea]|uniref:DNA polymerase n=1 Tax=Rickenella mellea TaxID=50990 RepID=A0A4Y7QI23_9AGAM|nr:Nucleotidyltransferase [Rickenella mellea]
MTPPEYAAKVLTKFQPLLDRTPPRKLFLKDKNIFYIGGDLKFASKTTRDKMDFVRKKGGTVVPVYDPSIVTHIVTDTTPIPTLKALALKSLTEIPDHIPTVLWSWITSGNRGKLEFEWMHAAFSSRIDADSSKRSSKGKEAQFPRQVAGTVSGGVTNSSVIDDDHHPQTPSSSLHPSSAAPPFSSAANPPQRTRHASQQCNGPEGDPLAEYYALAAADQESAESNDSSDGEMPMDEVVKQSRRGFTCDQRNTDNGHCLNQGIIDKLQELMELHKEKLSDHDRWRVFSYSKTIRALRNHPVQIKSYEQARAIKGVGDKTARKIEEIIQTGELRRIDWEKTPDVESIKNFKGIYDVGPHTAYQWYNAGCRTLDDVKARKGGITLTPTQKIGVEYYDDINSRMPRSEAEQIFNKIKPIALEIDPMLFIEIMGSFRRGKADCGDIDILITRPTHDGKTHAGVIRSLLTELHVRQIITEDLATPDNFDGLEATYRGLCRLDFRSRRRRIDILAVPYESRGAALLYYTGDDIFNRAIRYKAGSMGYSLNQRGLFTAVARDPNDRRKKLTKGYVIASETEEEIFKILNVPWQEPHERVRAV